MPKSIRRVALGVLLGAAVACTAVAPAFASAKRIEPTAARLRTAGIKVSLTVDGKPISGQVVKGREVEARIYLPAGVKLTRPTAVSLVDYQTTSFNLAKSDQRFLQATSTRLLGGKQIVLKLGIRCQLKVGRKCAGKLYKHQLDVVVGPKLIGASTPFKWLGTYPHYSGKQLLAGGFVKAKCRLVHKPKPCKCHRRG
jgi:hypothetical protein